MSLVEKLKESRRQIVTAGDYQFKIERPTAMDMEDYAAGLPEPGHVFAPDGQLNDDDRRVYSARWRYGRPKLLTFVRDWPGMREMDIIPGGTGAALEFDAELFMAWVSDQPDIADQLAGAVIGAWNQHNAAIEAAQKKPSPGINPDPSPALAETN